MQGDCRANCLKIGLNSYSLALAFLMMLKHPMKEFHYFIHFVILLQVFKASFSVPKLFYPLSYLLLLIMVYEELQQRYMEVISCTEHTAWRVHGNTVALSFYSAKWIESAPEISNLIPYFPRMLLDPADGALPADQSALTDTRWLKWTSAFNCNIPLPC